MLQHESESRILDADHTELLARSLQALLEDVPYLMANLANAAAFLYEALPELNWAGFYLLEQKEEERLLVLGPFQGRPACVAIPWGKGVCGTAAETNCLQLVPDVHQFPGHIACDAASASELVVPLHRKDGSLFGVLDLDSPVTGRFSEQDAETISRLAAVIEGILPQEKGEGTANV